MDRNRRRPLVGHPANSVLKRRKESEEGQAGGKRIKCSYSLSSYVGIESTSFKREQIIQHDIYQIIHIPLQIPMERLGRSFYRNDSREPEFWHYTMQVLEDTHYRMQGLKQKLRKDKVHYKMEGLTSSSEK